MNRAAKRAGRRPLPPPPALVFDGALPAPFRRRLAAAWSTIARQVAEDRAAGVAPADRCSLVADRIGPDDAWDAAGFSSRLVPREDCVATDAEHDVLGAEVRAALAPRPAPDTLWVVLLHHAEALAVPVVLARGRATVAAARAVTRGETLYDDAGAPGPGYDQDLAALRRALEGSPQGWAMELGNGDAACVYRILRLEDMGLVVVRRPLAAEASDPRRGVAVRAGLVAGERIRRVAPFDRTLHEMLREAEAKAAGRRYAPELYVPPPDAGPRDLLAVEPEAERRRILAEEDAAAEALHARARAAAAEATSRAAHDAMIAAARPRFAALLRGRAPTDVVLIVLPDPAGGEPLVDVGVRALVAKGLRAIGKSERMAALDPGHVWVMTMRADGGEGDGLLRQVPLDVSHEPGGAN